MGSRWFVVPLAMMLVLRVESVTAMQLQTDWTMSAFIIRTDGDERPRAVWVGLENKQSTPRFICILGTGLWREILAMRLAPAVVLRTHVRP